MARADRDLSATFETFNPATGEPIATLPLHSERDVHAAVVRARAAAAWWRDLGFDGRKRALLAYKGLIARRADDLSELVHRENGKPHDDAFLEVILAVDHLDWAARNAERVMRLRRVPSTPLMLDQRAYLEYLPVGVVGVIGPWNYPVHTPMGSISYALAAGNAVVFKPSEFTPLIGRRMAELFAEVVDTEPVFQVVTGFGETGHALVADPGVDVVAFTGSARTGRKVMEAAAANLTKVVMECGGKDAFLVDRDADLREAAEAALWGGCANAGQTCAGVERVYVHHDVYDRFVDEVVTQAEALHAGSEAGSSWGPMTMPAQVEIVRRHVEDALERGARAVVGGVESIREPFIDPVVMVDVPLDAPLMIEETFGPVIPIIGVPDMDEGVRLANESAYGLGASVYSRRRGMELARRLTSGMVSVNALLRYASIPALPFGGRGESGYGRIHGEDGLKEFTMPRAVTRRLFSTGLEFASFRRPGWMFPALGKVLRLLHGRHGTDWRSG